MLVCVYVANQMPPIFEFVTLMVAMLLHWWLSFKKRIKNKRCQLSSPAANGWIAEEPEFWDRTSACKGALLQPLQSMFWSHLAHPDQWRHKSDRPWHPGPTSPTLFEQFHRFFYAPLQLRYKDKGDKADEIIWTEKGDSQLAWSHQFFKDLGWKLYSWKRIWKLYSWICAV